MKSVYIVALAAILAPGLSAAADTGVAMTVGQPGFFGHIEIGNLPRPPVIFPEPVIIQRGPVGVIRAPLYLYVPPGHAKHWGKHCHKYNACGQPVYFVQDSWYQNVYVPDYRQKHGKHHDDDDDDHGGKRGDKGHKYKKDKH